MQTKLLSRGFFILVFLLVFVAEILLLEIKYNQIRGGFLQPYQFSDFSEIVFYLLVVSIIFFLFASSSFLLLRGIIGFLRFRSSLFLFHFAILFCVGYTLFIFLKYQLHIYFSDAMDLMLIKNIAGDLGTALSYVLKEGLILVLPFVLAIIFYWQFLKLVRRFQESRNIYVKNIFVSKTAIFKDFGGALSFFFVAVALIFFAKKYPEVDFAMNRQIAAGAIISTVKPLTDFDGDGVSLFSRPKDHAPFDPLIYPGAIDLPDNGIDENGLAGDFKLINHTGTPLFLSEPNVKPKHLIVIVMESARGDLLGKRLNGKLVAPNLTALSERGTYIRDAFSHTGYTSSSLYTLFSGSLSFTPSKQGLFRQLHKHGFQVSVISGQDESWGGLDSKLGTREVAKLFFDAQEAPEERVFPSRLASSIKLREETLIKTFNEKVIPNNWDSPQFVYFNFQAGHFPYAHKYMTNHFVKKGIPRSKISPRTREWLDATYWNSMNYADQYIGKLVDLLELKGVLKDTLIVVVGDHGESLFDDGFLGHGHYINDSQLRIPLVFSMPGIQIRSPVGLIDLYEILVEIYGLPKGPTKSLDPSNCVFHYVGQLVRPSTFGHSCKGGERVVFNMKDGLVQFDKADNWMRMEAIEASSELNKRLLNLFRHWENNVWIQKKNSSQ